MPISGVVVVLEEDGPSARAALEELRRRPNVTIGSVPDPRRVPITLESADPSEARRDLRSIEDLSGVLMVEVAFVDFGDLEPPAVETAHNAEDIR